MTNITVYELKTRMDAGEKLLIVDVREPSEYAEYNIDAKLIPLGNIMNMQLDDLEDHKNDEIIVHCKVGGRSMRACAMLETAGFTNVVNLVGGMDGWRQAFG
jgi:rhodanese-related sulfurtransferase